MHGLIFVTWEKYLSQRFSGPVIKQYQDAIGRTPSTAPLASHVYDDDLLLAAVTAMHETSKFPVDTLLREFGHYFLINGLTRHLCAYILTQVKSARDLLLAMHDAHEQMSRLPDGLTPPLFRYAAYRGRPNELTLIYDSPRKLCPLLMGAIEGAAERYGEQTAIHEQTCMRRGDAACTIKIRFSRLSTAPLETAEQVERQKEKIHFAESILSYLPYNGGVTLAELQKALAIKGIRQKLIRPALLLEALHHLHHAGLVATTANHTGDDFEHRRYWRVSNAAVYS
jgi:predicted hydrocarbon binding protein